MESYDYIGSVRPLLVLLCSLITVVVVVVVRTIIFSFPRKEEIPSLPNHEEFIAADQEAISRFCDALRFQTVSRAEGDYDRDQLLRFQKFLIEEFPGVFGHRLVTYEIINRYSILISVKGHDPSLRPYLIASHMDVVPASNDSWEVPPFDGKVKDGYIWGRGTLDMKNGVMGSLEALQVLLKREYNPRRSFYLAFGHDEEVLGLDGARIIGNVLHERGVRLEFVVDEGLVVTERILPGLTIPLALIGVAEKGYIQLKLSVNTEGGHASMPPKETSIGILAKAVSRLESRPMPVMFDSSGPLRTMMEVAAPQMSLSLRIVIANLWLFSPIFTRILQRKPSTNAILRTTTTVTQFNAGIKANALAPSATATVNHRVHPSNTIKQVIAYDKWCISDDRVQIYEEMSEQPSPVSRWDTDAFGYQVVSKSIRQVFPNAAVAPGLLVANTDTKHYLKLTDSVYRFLPSHLGPEDLLRIHGFNERISVKNYEQTINYFYQLMKNAHTCSNSRI